MSELTDAEREQAIYAQQAKTSELARDGWMSIDQGAAKWRKGDKYLDVNGEKCKAPDPIEPSMMDKAIGKLKELSDDDLKEFVEGKKRKSKKD